MKTHNYKNVCHQLVIHSVKSYAERTLSLITAAVRVPRRCLRFIWNNMEYK